MAKKVGCPFGEKPEGNYTGTMDDDDDVPTGTAKDMASIAENQGLSWDEIMECYDNERWNK